MKSPMLGGAALLIVLRKAQHACVDLLHVVCALRAVRLILGAGQGGQQHTREDTNDGDNHQQLDQGESLLVFLHIFALHVGLCALVAGQSAWLLQRGLICWHPFSKRYANRKNDVFLEFFAKKPLIYVFAWKISRTG